MIRRVSRQPAVVAAVAVAVVLAVGCAGEPPMPELEEPPAPDLTHLDAAVAELYRERRAALDRQPPAAASRPALGRAWGELGQWYHLYAGPAPARACYRNAGALATGELRWPYYRGHLAWDAADLDAARAAFERVLEIRPRHPAALAWLGELELAEGRPETAEPRFRAALAAAPEQIRAHVGLGKAALARRRFAAAVEHLEAGLRLQPEATAIHQALGLAYRGSGDLERARRYLEKAQVADAERVPLVADALLVELESLRRDARFYSDRGRRALAEGRFDDAARDLRRAVGIQPESAIQRLNLGLALLRSGRPEDAGREFEEALRLEPGNPKAYFGRALVRALAGERQAAEADYRAALAADPDYLEGHFNLANLLRRQGRFGDALEHYRRAVELEPAHRAARFWRAVALCRLERWGEARQALEETAGDPDLEALLARVLSAAPDPGVRDGARALGLALGALRRGSNLLRAETAAMAYAEAGDFERAAAWQRAGLEAAVAASPPVRTRVEARLRAYASGRPWREVWAPEEEPTPIPVRPPVAPADR